MLDVPGSVFLYTWWSSARSDHYTTSDPGWADVVGALRLSGEEYELVRIEGRVYSPLLPGPRGTVPLWNFWNASLADNRLSTQLLIPGYSRVRLEGYVFPRPGQDLVSLGSYSNALLGDNVATTGTAQDLPSLNAGWISGEPVGYLLPAFERVVALNTWYSVTRGDHFTTTAPNWRGVPHDRRGSGDAEYELVRAEGLIFDPEAPQPPGTVALWNLWNPERGDNFLTTQLDWVRTPSLDGYERFRLEGFLFTDPGPGRAALASYWNAAVLDNAATTADPGELTAPEWLRYRTEGYMFPRGTTVSLQSITDALVPTSVLEGDREFGGHGPDMTARLKLVVNADGRQLLARIYFRASETQADWSTTEATWERVVYTAPLGRQILALASPSVSEVRFIGTAAGVQFLFPSEDLKDAAELVDKVTSTITAILAVVPVAGGVAPIIKAIGTGLSAFLSGASIVNHDGNTTYTVMPVDGPALFFAIVGDTGGDDISGDDNPKDDTRIVAVKLLDVQVVMD